jgi:hypothetical protein
MITVSHEKDRVVVALPTRTNDVLLTTGEAEVFEHALRDCAGRAEKEPTTLLTGEVWEVQVVSYDRRVAMRVRPPLSCPAGRAAVMPMPVAAARALADRVQFVRQQAAYGVRFERAKHKRKVG